MRREEEGKDAGTRDDEEDLGPTTLHSLPLSLNTRPHHPPSLDVHFRPRKHQKNKIYHHSLHSISILPRFSPGALFPDSPDPYTHLHIIPDAPYSTTDDFRTNIETQTLPIHDRTHPHYLPLFISNAQRDPVPIFNIFLRMTRTLTRDGQESRTRVGIDVGRTG
jgi:hypothetical protein